VEAFKASNVVFINILIQSGAKRNVCPDPGNPFVDAAFYLRWHMLEKGKKSRNVTYCCKYQGDCLNCKRIEIGLVNDPFVLFVTEPHDIHHLLYDLRLVHAFPTRCISIGDLIIPLIHLLDEPNEIHLPYK
jgi:hypothetical protein